MNNLDLRAAARSLPVPPGNVDAVVERGATLARRRQRGIAGGTAVLLILSAVSYVALTRDSNRPTRVTVGDDGAAASLQRGDAGIRWERTPIRSGLSFTTSRSGDALYAVSTAPGTTGQSPNDMRPVVWHSDDGAEWSKVTELGDLYLSDLADRGARVYGVGTGPATAVVGGKKPVSDLVVGWSDSAGRDWSRDALPLDLRAMATKTRRIDVGHVEVAATDRAVIAVASLIADLDVPAVLPAGQTAPDGWVITNDGVDVLGNGPECPPGTSSTPPGEKSAGAKPRPSNGGDVGPGPRYPSQCYKPDGTYQTVRPQDSRGVKASYTWSQLSVNDDLRRAVLGEPFVFAADGGTTKFQRVDVPALAGKSGDALLNTSGDGVLLVSRERVDGWSKTEPKAALLKSVDGRTWSPATTPPGFSYAMGLGRLGGRTAIVGSTGSGAMLWLANPDGTWSASALGDAVDPVARKGRRVEVVAADVGPLGAVAVVSMVDDMIANQGGVTVVQNGYTLHILNDRLAATVTDSNGKEIARTDSITEQTGDDAPIRMVNGDGSVGVFNPGTGPAVVTFPGRAMQDAMGKNRTESAYSPAFRIVATRDGAVWSDEDVQALAKQRVASINSVLVKGERAVVAAMLPNPQGSKAPTKQVALVGTPK
ncbi:MAG: hypothetical protein H0W70_08050 [Actinobacteria bacterium]|nr:hypothetical protein [Actinomycetota bacterium]